MVRGVFFDSQAEKIFGGVLESLIVAPVLVYVLHAPHNVHRMRDFVGDCPEDVTPAAR
jgi:nucleoside diphosphate kinase